MQFLEYCQALQPQIQFGKIDLQCITAVCGSLSARHCSQKLACLYCMEMYVLSCYAAKHKAVTSSTHFHLQGIGTTAAFKPA